MKALHPEFKKALDNKFRRLRHFYLKVRLPEEKYPVGIVALGLTQHNDLWCAIMMCSKEDQFEKKFAQDGVYKRLYKLQKVYLLNKNKSAYSLLEDDVMGNSLCKDFKGNFYFQRLNFPYNDKRFTEAVRDILRGY